LQGYGFYVILLKDADPQVFEEAVNCFANDCQDKWRIREESVALFYYSGHGLVVLDKGKKTNFVLPKRDFKDACRRCKKTRGLSVDWILEKMQAVVEDHHAILVK
jgi:uncharacterized caspase-like protein